MSVQLIQDRLNSYSCQSPLEEEQALREITQEVALAALGRTDFFQHAAFHGGTCLRIFYGLNRFSEDLDFALREPEPSFRIGPFFQTIAEEVSAYGYRMEVQDRSKTETMVRKAFLKDDSIGQVLHLSHLKADRSMKKIRIKVEVDCDPPPAGQYESKFLDFPFVSSVTTHDLPSLFAGKIHALLCRQWSKGRDWYDFIWYTGRSTPVNLTLLGTALNQQGPWQGQQLAVDLPWCIEQLKAKIQSIDWKATARDVERFVRTNERPSLELWDTPLFLDQLKKVSPSTD